MQIKWVNCFGGSPEDISDSLVSRSRHLAMFASETADQEEESGLRHPILVFDLDSIGTKMLVEKFGAGFRLDTEDDYYMISVAESVMNKMLASESIQRTCNNQLELAQWWHSEGSLLVVASKGDLLAFGHLQIEG